MSESKDEARRPERDCNSVEEIPRSPTGATRGSGRNPEGRDVGQKIQRQLDDALADSFPASDPVSIVTSNEEEDWGDGVSTAAPTSENGDDTSCPRNS